MFESILNTIILGNFKRNEMLEKINTFYLYGDLTLEEADKLRGKVAEYMNAEAERPDILKLIQTLGTKIEALTERMVKLEQNSNTESDGEDVTEPETTKYEAWQPWDGISDKYQLGDIVEHNGVLYESTFSRQNTWEPGVAGTEALWKVYEVVV